MGRESKLALATAALIGPFFLLLLGVGTLNATANAVGSYGSSMAQIGISEYIAGNGTSSEGCKYWNYTFGTSTTNMSGSGNGTGTLGGAWCASFVSWCANEAGLYEADAATKDGGCAGWRSYYEASAKRGTVHKVVNGKCDYKPQVGDIWIAPGDSHIGIVAGTGAADTEYADALASADYTTELEKQRAAAVREKVDSVIANPEACFLSIEGNTYDPATGSSNRMGIDDQSYSSVAVFIHPNFTQTQFVGTGTVPEKYGTAMTYEKYNISWASGTRQAKLHAAWEKAGSTFDKDGFATIGGRYIIACTPKFGKVGDKIDWVLKNGQVIHTVMGDQKNMKDKNCNEWGHDFGKSMVEFCVDKKRWYKAPSYESGGHANPGTDTCRPEWKSKVMTWKNLGSGNYF